MNECLECIDDYELIDGECICNENGILNDRFRCFNCPINYVSNINKCICP